MSANGPSDLPPPRPGPLPSRKGAPAAPPPPQRSPALPLDLSQPTPEALPVAPPARRNRLPAVAFTVIAALLVTIIVLLATDRGGPSGETAMSPTTSESTGSPTSIEATATSIDPDSVGASPTTGDSQSPAAVVTSIDDGQTSDEVTTITVEVAEQVADRYLAVSSENDPEAFIGLWSYPADHYGDQLDAAGMRAATLSYFSSNPQRSFQRVGAVSVTPGASGVNASFDYEFNLTRADGETRCGVRRLTLRLVGPDAAVAAANETKVSDCS